MNVGGVRTSVNFFKRKPSKSFTPITFEYLQHKRNIYEGYWYRKPSFLLIKRNTPENNFESIHENSNEDEDEDDDDDDDSNNAEAEEESLTSNISHSSVLFFENMELSNSDAENYSFNNYASDNNNICEKAEPIEFPNNAYADLMALVTNYNLSNEVTNAVIYFFNEHSNLPLSPLPKNAKKGCELMEKMKIPTLTSKKHKILTHNNIDYYLFYYPYKGEKAYSEQYTGNWWKNTEASLPDGSKLLSIILYSDATTTDTLGIDLEVDNETYWFFLRISTIICDWLEATTFSLVYKSTNSNFPCHFCLISKTLLSNTDLSDITFRNNENMQEYFYNDAGQDVSLENIPNYFWSLPSINIYTATVPDRMHHLDLELFQYQIKFTQALFQKQDSSLVGKIDNRLSKIPQFQKFQMFTNGLQSISRMTAKEYRILMKVMVFVVDNLYEENKNNVEDFVENRKLSEVYAKWNKMYMMSRSEIFTESDLENFQKDTFEWAKLFVEIFKLHSSSNLKFLKFHSWIYHIFESIRQFGAINRYTTETYESLHKDFVKIPYRMSNKKKVKDQIMKALKRQDIINVINKKQKKKKPTKLLNFSLKLFETKLTEAYIYFCEKINDPNINDNMIKGFDQFLKCFDDFLENILEIKDIKECDIIIYAISMDSNESSDEGLYYGKILLMAKIEIKEESLLNLALVQ
ncbi:hypothetical protein Glove_30g11 [Diversispora epigaea]|uniref:Uncharacterized protein n=1 Tax=Diversispora epigaea TaxID=1348612 RepID=A0A397JTP6_9GLOM|nr:hypothetical protein Glove_30g11 [Diversispora epigaea]